MNNTELAAAIKELEETNTDKLLLDAYREIQSLRSERDELEKSLERARRGPRLPGVENVLRDRFH